MASSFQASLLAKLNASSAAAKAVAKRKEDEKKAAVREEERRKAEQARQRLREEGEKIVSRNVSRSVRSHTLRQRQQKQATPRRKRNARPFRGRGRRGGGGGGDASSSEDEDDHDDDGVPDDLAKTSRAAIARRNRGAAAAGARRRQHTGPPKAVPGMEFVVRKTKRKQIHVPHASDYSDMFGDQFLRGLDLKMLKDMKKETAVATAEAKQIISERKAKTKAVMEEAQKHLEEEKELERQGKLTTKVRNSRRLELSAKDWVAVDVPVPLGGSVPAGAIERSEAAASSSNAGRKMGGAPLSKREKVTQEMRNKNDTEARKRALQERIMALGGRSAPASSSKAATPAKAVKRSRAQRDSDDDELSDDDYSARKRRKAIAEPVSRKRSSLDDDRSGGKRRASYREDERRMSRERKRRYSDDEEEEERPRSRRRTYSSDEEDYGYRRRQSRGKEEVRGDISDEWSEDEDNSGYRGGGGLTAFNDMDELEAEELESERIGRLEDKRELANEKRRKKLKEERLRKNDDSESD